MLRLILTLLLLVLPSVSHAQEDDFAERLVFAKKMLEIRPADAQLSRALDMYIEQYMFNDTPEDRIRFRDALLKTINAKALEKFAVDAYAETFTLLELRSMVEYYSKPEAQSAGLKMNALNSKISPEIVRMLDQALMRVKTEATRREAD